MEIIELLSKERQDYLSLLLESLREYQAKSSRATAEVLLQINESTKSPPYSYIRPDIIHGGAEKPQIVEVNKSKYYNFQPIGFKSSGGISGRLFPFYWNGMEFRLHGNIDEWSDFEKWIHYWMDIDDARYEKDKVLSNVIHNVTVPKFEDGYFEFSVDMGSAEVDAFLELVTLFAKMKVTRIDVGSFSMIDSESEE